MKGQIDLVEDNFWTERLPLFTAQFPSYYTKPQRVWGRFHHSTETFSASSHQIIPLSAREGHRTYVMMHPFVFEPKLTLTIGLHKKPKHYADQDSPIGETIGNPQHEGFEESPVGNAQAWYYHTDKTIVLWECFFASRFRHHPFAEDRLMQDLWRGFEQCLLKQFPKATTLATPFNDPIARSPEEYQTFLKTLGYSPLAKAAFGKSARM